MFVDLFGEAYIVLQSIVSAFFLLMLAELIPKNFAACYPERLIYLAAYIIRVIRVMILPIVAAMKFVNRVVLRWLGDIRVQGLDKHAVTRDDLRGVIGMADGGISPEYQDMLKGVLNLDDLTVNDVMIPRRDMQALDMSMPWHDLKKAIGRTTASRVVLYNRNLDHLVGVACKKLLYQLYAKGEVNRNLFVQSLLPVNYIPEGTPLSTQMKAFRKARYDLGVVVDEYGSVLGIVTLADIIDEVIRGSSGEISRQSVVKTGVNVFEVAGDVPIRDFNHAARWELPTGGPVTISGLVIETLESLPKGLVCVEIGDYRIEVVSMDAQRIKRVRVCYVKA